MQTFIELRQKVEIWTNGVLQQIKRIEVDCINIEQSIDYTEKWKNNVLRINDDHFLKIAMNNTIIWLEKFNNYVEETKDIYNELSNIKEIKDLRNMAEHEIEYYYGKGHYRSRYKDKTTLLTASETGITEENEYLIGGRLKLSYVKNIFGKLKDIIDNNNFTSTGFEFEKIFGTKLGD